MNDLSTQCDRLTFEFEETTMQNLKDVYFNFSSHRCFGLFFYVLCWAALFMLGDTILEP